MKPLMSVYKDGTSQSMRLPKALDPTYYAVDERETVDLLKFIQFYAKEIFFYDINNAQSGDWSGFLLDDIAVTDAVQFLQNPDDLDEDKLKKLLQPHRILLLVFLLLLRYPQQQFKDLTRRRLEFYYRQCLQLQEKPAQPDQAHVIFQLADAQEEYFLPKGTLLTAGEDEQGNLINYGLDYDIKLNHAQLANISSLVLDQMTIDLVSQHANKTDQDFENMLRWALGQPKPGDPLPVYNKNVAVDIVFLKDLYEKVRSSSEVDMANTQDGNYILQQLCFINIEEFKYCLKIHMQQISPTQQKPTVLEWQQVYDNIEKAYHKKIILQRRSVFKNLNETNGFEKMLIFALGNSDLNNSSLSFPEPYTSLQNLRELKDKLKTLLDSDPNKNNIINYINEQLQLTKENFLTIMNIAEKPAATPNEWEEVYRLVEQAQSKKRNFNYPSLAVEKIQDVYSDILFDSTRKDLATLKRFKPFNQQSGKLKTMTTCDIGFAITSPLLFLKEGKRSITLTLACIPEGFDEKYLNTTLNASNNSPLFSIYLSGAEQWIIPKDLINQVGNFISGVPTARYASENLAKSSITSALMITDIQIVSGIDKFSPNVVNKVLLWSNNEVFKVKEYISDQKIKVVLLGNIKKTFDLILSSSAPTSNSIFVGTNSMYVLVQSPSSAVPSDLYFVDRSDTVPAISRIIFPVGKSVTDFAQIFSSHIISNVFNGIVNLTPAQLNQIKLLTGHNPEKNNNIYLYNEDDLFLNAFQWHMDLSENIPAITNPQNYLSNIGMEKFPVVKVLLANNQYYENLRSIRIQKAKITVTVSGVKNIQARSDDGVLNAQSLFQPFGYQPQVGSGFYFSNTEICNKKLDYLFLDIKWSNLPKNFKIHYNAYKNLLNETITNDSFKTQLVFLNNQYSEFIGDALQPLFDENNDILMERSVLQYNSFSQKEFSIDPMSFITAPSDPFEWQRYFKLILLNPDFQHTTYATVLSKMNATETVYPPYTPTIQSFSIHYGASSLIDLTTPESSIDYASDMLQLNPFGNINYRKLALANPKEVYLLEQYREAAYLYMGFNNLKIPTELSLLFQLLSGSSGFLENQPDIVWSYLTEEGWIDFDKAKLLRDTTNNLLNSGIIALEISKKASNQNSIMPQGLHWLRAASKKPVMAADILDIRTQAISVTLKANTNAALSVSKPLPPNTINNLLTINPAIQAVIQPYSSFGGKPQENAQTFWARISERLRHKQRALSGWDYERLILAAFPQIYKVKCMPKTMQGNQNALSTVVIIVIPDISNSAPFFPLEPKVPTYLLTEIKEYLEKYTSPFVKLDVRNPSFEQIQYRIAVRFKKNCEEGFYIKQLNEDIKRFLSPWAYENQVDISFGSCIHHSQLIYFIEQLSYIEYVIRLKLTAHRTSTDIVYPIDDVNLVQVQNPDAILVSAPQHIIDILVDDNYTETFFEGIGYMMIEVDFIVS